MNTLTSVRFNMRANIVDFALPDKPSDDPTVTTGEWKLVQDEDTGAMTRIWVETAAPVPGYDELAQKIAIQRGEMECYVRGFPEVGFRSTANTESFLKGDYSAFEAIKFVYPIKYTLSRRQYITNIRTREGVLLWIEEETGQPTVFEVQGVTPEFDPFGRHVQNLAVLKRAAIQ